MTRLAVLADIHGNLPALEAVIADIAQFNVDQVVVAGDMINLGPFSKAVLERIFALGWTVIRGNHENYLLDFGTPRCSPFWNGSEILSDLVKELDGPLRNRLALLSEKLVLHFPDAASVHMVHGSPRGISDGIFPKTPDSQILEKLAGLDEETLICAHSHILIDRQVGRWHVLNPGSVGIPVDGNRQASYMILDGSEDGWCGTPRRIDFDLEPILEEFQRQEAVERHGAIGYLLVEQFKTACHYVSAYFRWHAEHYPNAPQTVENAKEFLDSGRLLEYVDDILNANME